MTQAIFPEKHSPKDIGKGPFSFCVALSLLKDGGAVTRSGWTEIGRFIYIVPPGRYKPCSAWGERVAGFDGRVPYSSYIALSTPKNFGEVIPWVASQTDLLSNDWYMVQRE